MGEKYPNPQSQRIPNKLYFLEISYYFILYKNYIKNIIENIVQYFPCFIILYTLHELKIS